jgi:hypothetical protein
MVNVCDGVTAQNPCARQGRAGKELSFEQEAAELTENPSGDLRGLLFHTRMLIFNRLALSESVPNPCDPRHPWFHSPGVAENKLNLIEYMRLCSHLIVV